MKFDEKINKLLSELVKEGENLLKSEVQTLPIKGFDFSGKGRTIHRALSYRWGTTCLDLLERVFGKENTFYKKFDEFSSSFDRYDSFVKALGVISAARNAYKNGYLFDTRALIEAEVFGDFLEQAEHLLSQGYSTASAVIAGSVLEDSLRKLCIKNGIALSAKPKLDAMNADLAKVGIYNLLKQKQITALADLRNKAAHGQGGFTKEDVEAMIKDVRRFTADYFS
jgi:hypothetical protein